MGFSEFWLQSNGKKMSLQNLKELKKSDLKGNPELIKLFDFFNTNKLNGSEEVLDKEELTSLFNTMQKSAQSSKGKDSSIFETEEAEEFINTTQTSDGKTLKELGVKATDMFEFLSKLVKTSNSPLTVDNIPTNVNLTEEQAQEEVISILSNDAAEARTLLMKQDNGVVTDLYNKYKEWRDDDLSLSNIEEAVVLQQEGADNLYKAKEGKLSKREYFLQNREHLKTMMKRRLFRKDENTGLDFLDRNRGKMTKEQFAKFMEEYINEQIDKIDKLDSLKNIQHKLFVTTDAGVEQMLKNYKKGAEEQVLHNPIAEQRFTKIKTPKIPKEFDTTEPMTFEEVFRFERNQEYSKRNVENYLRQKQRIDFATGAYNKYQSFKMASDEFLDNYKKSTKVYSDMDGKSWGGKEPNPNEQMNKVIELFTAYYDNPFKPDLAKEKLEHLISENNLPISVITKEDGSISLDLSRISNDNQKNRVLNQLVKLEAGKLKTDLETTFGGDIEEKLASYASKTQSAYTNAYGQDFTQELAQEMEADNKTFIQRYTGNTSMVGMGLTVVGGILCFTPAAPLGAGMVTAGNTLAIGGMVAESGLGYTEALTRSSLDEEELKELSKTLVMNAGGFVIGMQAGKTGMKAFNKLIDKKLAEVFRTEMVKGNRAEALKQVFTNPKHLKNFMKAAGVKLSTDFIISYAGDLAMMGVLDTQDDWQSLLQANLIGIMTGMSDDIKEAARLGMKGDRYRALRQKEVVNGLTAEESKELATLRNDPDIKRQPTLSEIDKIARAEDVNQANLSPYRFNDVKGKRAQAQVSHYLDYLLESIPSDVKEAPIDAIKKYDDFILPNGTVISRNHAGDNGKFVYDEKTKTHVTQDVDNAVLFWIKDANGQEHVLPCLTPENVAKARKLIGYLATQEAVPRDNIDVVQKQVLEFNKAQTEADVTHAKPHNGKAVKVLPAENGEGFIVKIGEEAFTAKDLDEVKNIIDTKAKDADNIDFSALELKEDVCASTDSNSSTTSVSTLQKFKNFVKKRKFFLSYKLNRIKQGLPVIGWTKEQTSLIDKILEKKPDIDLNQIEDLIRGCKNADTIEVYSSMVAKYANNQTINDFDIALEHLLSNVYMNKSSKTYNDLFNAVLENNLSPEQVAAVFQFSGIHFLMGQYPYWNDLTNIIPLIKDLDIKVFTNIASIISAAKKGLGFGHTMQVQKAYLDALEAMPQDVKDKIVKQGIAIDKLEDTLRENTTINGTEVHTDKESQQRFLKTIIGNNPKATEVISGEKFTQVLSNYEQSGLPLKYSRNKFINDIKTLLSQLPENEQSTILRQLGINMNGNDFTGFVKSENIDVSKFSNEFKTTIEKIKNKVDDFIYNNEIKIDDPKIKAVLDDLIKGFPEFISIIGRQNGGHGNTLDYHTLKVLQNAMQDPVYPLLSDEAKTILKFSILLHDLGKTPNINDNGAHSGNSAIYATAILDKFNFSQDTKERIINMVKHHHFSQEKGINYYHYFRLTDDRLIARTLGKADAQEAGYKINVSATEATIHPLPITRSYKPKYESFGIQKRIINGVEYEFRGNKISEMPEVLEEKHQGYVPGTKKNDIVVQVTSSNHLNAIKNIVTNYDNPNYDMTIQTSTRKLIDSDNGYGGYSAILSTGRMNIGGGNFYNTRSSGYGHDFDFFTYNGLSEDGAWSPIKIPSNIKLENTIPEVIKYLRQFRDSNDIPFRMEGIKIGDKVYDWKFLKETWEDAQALTDFVGKVETPEKLKDTEINGKKYTKKQLFDVWKAISYDINVAVGNNERYALNPKVQALVIHVDSWEKVPDEAILFSVKYKIPLYIE